MWPKARTSITAYFKTAAHRDADNLLSSCKAYFDGITDAGVLMDDSGLSHDAVTILKDSTNPRIVITITPTL